MQSDFTLTIATKPATWTAEFRLCDHADNQLAYQHTDFTTLTIGEQQRLFYLRDFLDSNVDAGNEAAEVEQLGICIADKVLGADIMMRLWQAGTGKTLRIVLPGAGQPDNLLAAALARVPWECARPMAGQPSLLENHLVLRIEQTVQAEPAGPVGQNPSKQAISLANNEELRVLFVFAEAKGSQPLGMRKEKQLIAELFSKEIYPKRKVVAHFLSHGVTRARLRKQISDNNGYHIVHWSGHGNRDVLELAKPGGAADYLSGPELAQLFTRAGVALPQLFFLSACNSGDAGEIKSMDDVLAVAQGKPPRKAIGKTNHNVSKDIDLAPQPGFTGTAHALVQRGVPAVVAMRFAVGDDYARELAREFYRAILAIAKPRAVSAALDVARNVLQQGKWENSAHFDPCDHMTPVLYGGAAPAFALANSKSSALDPAKQRNRRLQANGELSPQAIRHFVGRTWELAGLGADFIGGADAGVADEAETTQAATKPVALITGLGGMGKTALCAEALALWEEQFHWVLIFQAKPHPLNFEATLREIHLALKGELQVYHAHLQDNPADAIYREADAAADFTGQKRLRRMMANLVLALQSDSILLVLDNFETNLTPQPRTAANDAEPCWECQDPAWDECLAQLASGLEDAASRVLITCRRPLAALARANCHRVALGPLAASEAGLYLREHPVLSRMMFSADEEERKLALRLFYASRFHPLLMDRLALLAADPGLRTQLLAALTTLETRKDATQLPALFAGLKGDGRATPAQIALELAYLDDALVVSIDQLIESVDPDARRVLWLVALANEPVTRGLLKAAWHHDDESEQQQQLRQLKQWLEELPQLPAEMQAKLQAELQALPPEIHALLAALPPKPQARPDIAAPLRKLSAIGLASEQAAGPQDDNPLIACHEVVRERIKAWMAARVADQDGLSDKLICLAYADCLAGYYKATRHQNLQSALVAGGRAIVYCIQAGEYEKLGEFASDIVTGSNDRRLLEGLLPHLRSAADAAPAGQPRWRCLGYLADALRGGGQPDASLESYQQAIELARAATGAEDATAGQAWAGLAVLCGNAANAYRQIGQLDSARRHYLESAEAAKQAARPAIEIIGPELEALRIDIMQGRAGSVLPQIANRLARVALWWQHWRAGQTDLDTPDPEPLARTYISALDIARKAATALEDWPTALGHLDTILEVVRLLQRPATEIADTRFNRATVLGRLRRFGAAMEELQACLQLFQHDPAKKAKVLSGLADLYAEQGDLAQALTQERRALALCEGLPDPSERAISHNNLAIYLERGADAQTQDQARWHQLAALLYFLVSGLGQHLQTSLHNYANNFRRAEANNTPLFIPRIADLLIQPGFDPLAQWLRLRAVDLEALQAEVDQLLEHVRQHALAAPAKQE